MRDGFVFLYGCFPGVVQNSCNDLGPRGNNYFVQAIDGSAQNLELLPQHPILL